MPSNKEKVTSYLNTDEEQAFKKFRDENKLSNSEAVNLLIKNHLIEGEKNAMRGTEKVNLLDKAILPLEQIEKNALQLKRFCQKNEKLEEQISYLQNEVEELRGGTVKAVEYFTDDQIASYVGAREETVKEWRLGLRKPRGENICRKLGRFELDFGRWKFRS